MAAAMLGAARAFSAANMVSVLMAGLLLNVRSASSDAYSATNSASSAMRVPRGWRSCRETRRASARRHQAASCRLSLKRTAVTPWAKAVATVAHRAPTNPWQRRTFGSRRDLLSQAGVCFRKRDIGRGFRTALDTLPSMRRLCCFARCRVQGAGLIGRGALSGWCRYACCFNRALGHPDAVLAAGASRRMIYLR